MSQGRILLISDSQLINKTVVEILANRDYETVVSVESGRALRYLDNDFDLVILRCGLAGCDIKNFVQDLIIRDSSMVILLMVEDSDFDLTKEFPTSGIFETVKFPLNNVESFSFLVKTASHAHSSIVSYKRILLSLEERNSSLQKQNILLANRVEEASKNLGRMYEDLRKTYVHTVKSLIEAIDARDHYTRGHSEKVSRRAVLLAEEMGLSVKEIETIRQAGELHDVGKIGIEDSILTKPGALNDEEWVKMKLHSIKGAQILEPLTFLGDVASIVRQNHERYGGGGYPDGLKGEEIALGARIISLADAYDVMTSIRSYRKDVFSKQQAIEEVKRNSGKQFDPKVVEAFLRIVDKF